MLRISAIAFTLVLRGSLANNAAGDGRDGCQIRIIASNAKGTDIAMESLSSVSRTGQASIFDQSGLFGNDMMIYQHNQTDIEFLAASKSSCTSESRYRIVLKRGTATRTVLFPSATEYTSEKTLRLGNLARHF